MVVMYLTIFSQKIFRGMKQERLLTDALLLNAFVLLLNAFALLSDNVAKAQTAEAGLILKRNMYVTGKKGLDILDAEGLMLLPEDRKRVGKGMVNEPGTAVELGRFAANSGNSGYDAAPFW